jgi:hypothetical protein
VSDAAKRIVLAERAPRPDYAVALGADGFVVEGVPLLPARRVAARGVYGLERSGARLWVGAGFVPLVLGGKDVPAERLARVEAELRAQVGALPDGRWRLARFDARHTVRLHRPWLTAAAVLALVLTFALEPHPVGPLSFATDLLLLLTFGLLAEPWLGALRVLATGAVALLAAGAVAPAEQWLALAPLALALGWAGLLAVVRLRREPELSVRFRSALDAGALLALVLGVRALAVGESLAALTLAALAGVLFAPLVLRGWPGGARPRLQ